MRVLYTSIAAVLILAVCFSAQAQENDDAQAEAAFKEGVEHFKAKRYEEAATAFRKANELKSNWKLLYNIGQSEAAAKRHGLALQTFEAYLSKAGDDVREERRSEVLIEVRRLRDMVGYLKVTAPDGALVSVDGVERGHAPIKTEFPVAAGVEHTITAIHNGMALPQETIQVSGGKTADVDLVVPESTKTPVAPEPKPIVESEPVSKPEPEPEPQLVTEPRKESNSTVKTVGWVVTGVGAALLVGGTITGAMALTTDKELDKNCSKAGCEEEYWDDSDKLGKLANATNILIGVGAGFAVAGVIMVIVGSKNSKEEESAKVRIAPTLTHDFAGASIQGRF